MTPYRRPDIGLVRALLLNPKDTLARAMLSDWYREHGDDKAADLLGGKSGRLPVDDWTAAACLKLNGCTFAPGSWDKRFVQDVCQPVANWWQDRQLVDPPEGWQPGAVRYRGPAVLLVAKGADDNLTIKQTLWVWKLAKKYRRQINDKTLQRRAAELLEGCTDD